MFEASTKFGENISSVARKVWEKVAKSGKTRKDLHQIIFETQKTYIQARLKVKNIYINLQSTMVKTSFKLVSNRFWDNVAKVAKKVAEMVKSPN